MSETNQNSNKIQASGAETPTEPSVQEDQPVQARPSRAEQPDSSERTLDEGPHTAAKTEAADASAAASANSASAPAEVLEEEILLVETPPVPGASALEEPEITTESIMAYGDEELDDFAKALLDKKTEMAIYADVMREPEQPETPQSLAQVMKDNKEAEDSMADALDELRRERGQVPIDQEEEDFAWSQTVVFEDRFDGAMDEDFTTESLFSKDVPEQKTTVISGYNASEQRNYIEETEKRPVHQKKIRSRAARNKAKAAVIPVEAPAVPAQASASADQMPPVPAAEEPASTAPASGQSVLQSVYVDEQNDKERRARLLKWAVAIIIAGALCLGLGYWYKTEVYDVNHSTTTEQQQTYDKLKTYADDYDTLSDAQKKDMAALLNAYSSMSNAQKDEINSYFKEKTGKTYVELTAEITDGSSSTSSSSNDQTQTDTSKDSSDTTSTDNEEDQAAASSNGTSSSGTSADGSSASSSTQNQTGTSGSSAAQTPSVQTPSSSGTTSSQPSSGTVVTDNSQAIAQYEQEIAQLQTDRANYIDFLASEGLPTSDEITASYDAQIAYYQNLLNALR